MFNASRIKLTSKSATVPKVKASPPHQCFLTVSLKTKRKTLRQFEAYATRLLEKFANAGLILKASGWKEAGEDVEIFNLWELKDANTLIAAELKLVDDPQYLLLDSLLEHEVKEITVAVTAVSFAPQKSTPEEVDLEQRYCYVKVANDLETSNLAEFRARHEASIDWFRESAGWLLGDGFLGVTGGDGITQLWRVPQTNVSSVADYLSRTPWDDLLEAPPTFEIFQPTPWDPEIPGRAISPAHQP